MADDDTFELYHLDGHHHHLDYHYPHLRHFRLPFEVRHGAFGDHSCRTPLPPSSSSSLNQDAQHPPCFPENHRLCGCCETDHVLHALFLTVALVLAVWTMLEGVLNKVANLVDDDDE